MPRELRGDECAEPGGRGARVRTAGMRGAARGSPPALPAAIPSRLAEPRGRQSPQPPEPPAHLPHQLSPPARGSAAPRAAPLPAAAPGAGGHRGRGPSASAHTAGGCGRCAASPRGVGLRGKLRDPGEARGGSGPGTGGQRRAEQAVMRGQRGGRSGTPALLPAAALGWHSQSEQL